MPVEGDPGTVIAHGRAGVGVRSRLLHIAERHTSIESGGDKSVPEGVRPDRLSDPGPPGHSADDAASGMAVEALPIGADKDRSDEPLADSEVDRSGRTRR